MAVTVTTHPTIADVDPGITPRGGSLTGLVSEPGVAVKVATIVFDASYPTGGETLTPADFGLKDIVAVVVVHSDSENFGDVRSGFSYSWDKANTKLVVYATDGVEVANATDLSVTSDDTFWVFGYL